MERSLVVSTPHWRFAHLLLACLLASFQIASAQTTFEELAQAATRARDANDVPKAIRLYQSALLQKPDWPEGLFYLGSLLYDSDQFAAAESALNRFVRSTPDSAPALGLLGLCEFETGHYTESLVHLQKAPPQTGQMAAVLRFHEAQLLTKTGAYDNALKLFATFLNNGEAPSAVILPLGIAALRQPLMTREVAPQQQDLYTAAGKAAAAILTGDAVRSQALLSDLLTRFPQVPGVHYLRGFYMLGQNPALAMDEFRRELEISSSNASANAMLAWMLLNQRDSAAALPLAKKAIAIAPDDALAEYVYGRSQAESNEIISGIAYLEKSVRSDPQNLEFHLALVSAYSKAGRTQEARLERQRSMQLAREVAPAYLP